MSFNEQLGAMLQTLEQSNLPFEIWKNPDSPERGEAQPPLVILNLFISDEHVIHVEAETIYDALNQAVEATNQ